VEKSLRDDMPLLPLKENGLRYASTILKCQVWQFSFPAVGRDRLSLLVRYSEAATGGRYSVYPKRKWRSVKQ
jgi:hypothetical protein